ncbi:Fur family transcriptional regulator [Flaviflexus massiliensis]|uniref:Fur family transcriptional regulator n=1 Tax=Flaviflexus massiliensis TaxID=1522309 RepID=UPI0006D53FF8|nr:Fur family transcriptional regulator [Flaviflexus massiliensis]
MAPDENVDALRQAGLRVTAPRLAALAVIAQHRHADAELITEEVRDRLGSVSTQAVYDVLHALTNAGLVRKITLDGRKSRYEISEHDNHHHILCDVCGRIENIPCVIGEAPCMMPSEDHGFAVNEAEVIYHGTCPDCREAALAQ